MRIAAVADIHYPRFYSLFEKSLENLECPDIFLLAGDIVNRGKSEGYSIVVDAIDSFFGNVPIIACFGNEDYNMFHNENQILELVGKRVTFLDNSSVSLPIGDTAIGIIGISNITERVKDVSSIRAIFDEQSKWISRSIEELADNTTELVVLSHYSPLSENDSTFSWWFKEAIKNHKPSFIVHGHVHEPIENKIVVESTPVYNVALPAVGFITEINL